jgi:hypothetical protein
MSKSSINLTIILFLAFSFGSCTKEANPVDSYPYPEILPLKIGNSWTYRVSTFDSAGAVQSIDTLTRTVLRDTMIQAQQWYITSFGIYRNASDGLWSLYYGAPILNLKFPSAVSDTFMVTGNTIIIQSTNEPKLTPVGTLSCYDYLMIIPSYGGFQTHIYSSPGNGWVSFESAGVSPNGRWKLFDRYELISYHLN